MAKEFTLAEVAKHNTQEDLYMVIRDEVYEITKFVSEVREWQNKVAQKICLETDLISLFVM